MLLKTQAAASDLVSWTSGRAAGCAWAILTIERVPFREVAILAKPFIVERVVFDGFDAVRECDAQWTPLVPACVVGAGTGPRHRIMSSKARPFLYLELQATG